MDRKRATTRRALLRAGIAVGAVATGSGCSSIPGIGGGTSDDGAIPGTGDAPPYTAWIPSPGAISEETHQEYTLLNVASLVSNRSHLDDGVYADNRRFFDALLRRFGSSIESVSGHLSIGSEALVGDGPRVLTGDYDAESVRSTLEDAAYSQSSSNGDYVTFAGDGTAYSAVAVGPDGIVLLESGDPATVETVVESKRGSNRYLSNPDFEALAGELGIGFLVSGGTNPTYEEERIRVSEPQFVGQVAAGATLAIDGSTTTVEYVFVFEGTDVVETAPVEEWLNLERTEGLVVPFTPGEVQQDGRIVTATGTTETGSLLAG